jgi:hypothetical protein
VTAKKSKPGAKAVPARRYIESSALVAALLEGDLSARASIRADGQRVTSALTATEALRAVLRARLSGRITASQQRAAIRSIQTFSRRCFVVDVTEPILAEAGHPFPVEPIRTLDAIHLATAAALGDPPALVTIVTRDIRVRDNALALGYSVE